MQLKRLVVVFFFLVVVPGRTQDLGDEGEDGEVKDANFVCTDSIELVHWSGEQITGGSGHVTEDNP